MPTNRALAVGLKTLGHYNYYSQLLKGFGIDNDAHLKDFLHRKDVSIERKRNYKAQPRVKALLARKRMERMQKGREEVRKSNAKGHKYESGMSVDEHNKENTNPKKRCQLCNLTGHTTKRSKKCKFNIVNMASCQPAQTPSPKVSNTTGNVAK